MAHKNLWGSGREAKHWGVGGASIRTVEMAASDISLSSSAAAAAAKVLGKLGGESFSAPFFVPCKKKSVDL